MAQAVELAGLFEKLIELLGRCLRVHYLTVPLSEQPLVSLPLRAESLSLSLVFRLEHLHKLNAMFVDRDRPDLVVLRRLDLYRLTAYFDCCAADSQPTACVIEVAELERRHFSAPCTCDDRKLHIGLELQVLARQTVQHLGGLGFREDLNLRIYHTGDRELFSFRRVGRDDFKFMCRLENALQNGQVPPHRTR